MSALHTSSKERCHKRHRPARLVFSAMRGGAFTLSVAYPCVCVCVCVCVSFIGALVLDFCVSDVFLCEGLSVFLVRVRVGYSSSNARRTALGHWQGRNGKSEANSLLYTFGLRAAQASE